MPPRARVSRRRDGYVGTSCPSCRIPLRHESIKTGMRFCPRCAVKFEAVVFSPVERRVVVPEMAGLSLESAAPCATHARNQAVAACGHCGKFMCELCKIEADQKVYCPGCFERLSAEEALAGGVTHYRNYEGLSGCCLFLCLLIWPLAAPLGLYYTIRGLRDKSRRGEPEGQGWLVVRAVLFSVLCVVIVFWIVAVFGAFRR